VVKPWFNSKIVRPKVNYGSRKTYIDDIFHHQDKLKLPAPNSYNVTYTEESMKLRLAKLKEHRFKLNEKATFLDTA
jgi:hypothetical protein